MNSSAGSAGPLESFFGFFVAENSHPVTRNWFLVRYGLHEGKSFIAYDTYPQGYGYSTWNDDTKGVHVISNPNFQFDMAIGGDLDPLPPVRPRPRAGVHGQPEAVRDQGDHQHVQRRPGGLQCLLPARLLDERLGIVL